MDGEQCDDEPVGGDGRRVAPEPLSSGEPSVPKVIDDRRDARDSDSDLRGLFSRRESRSDDRTSKTKEWSMNYS